MARSNAVHRSAAWSLYALALWPLLARVALAAQNDWVNREWIILEGEIILPGEEEEEKRWSAPLEERQNNNNNYQFTGALAIYGGGSGQTYVSGGQQTGSPAVQAQCPADHPVSCTGIGEPYYCCPSGNYCAWSNSIVSCCPNGATCYAEGQWQPTSTYWTPAPTSTVYVGGGYVQPAATTVVNNNGEYCSTIVAVGPGLPTTGQGSCGTILILAGEAVMAQALDVLKLVGVVIGLQLFGGVVLLRR